MRFLKIYHINKYYNNNVNQKQEKKKPQNFLLIFIFPCYFIYIV